ncbi:MAG: RsmE family RNA methyltransferase [Elusimicrobiota bacterium]
MNKIFVEKHLEIGENIKIKESNLHHLKVINISPGDTILIGDKNGNEYEAGIIEVEKNSCLAKVKKSIKTPRKPVRKVSLFVSIPKKKKMEDIIFRCSQLGINEFYPFISSRTIKKLKTRNFKKTMRRWKLKSKYGAELSKRDKIPDVNEIKDFNQVLKIFRNKNYDKGIIMWEEEKSKYISDKDKKENIALFIGPEGGFSKKEIKKAKQYGAVVRSLGPLVVDVETACISSSAILLCSE